MTEAPVMASVQRHQSVFFEGGSAELDKLEGNVIAMETTKTGMQ
jgi:hypothetical protein